MGWLLRNIATVVPVYVGSGSAETAHCTGITPARRLPLSFTTPIKAWFYRSSCTRCLPKHVLRCGTAAGSAVGIRTMLRRSHGVSRLQQLLVVCEMPEASGETNFCAAIPTPSVLASSLRHYWVSFGSTELHFRHDLVSTIVCSGECGSAAVLR